MRACSGILIIRFSVALKFLSIGGSTLTSTRFTQVALSIATVGGNDIVTESASIIRRYGKLPCGAAHSTTAGNLDSYYVIHAVGKKSH